VNYCIGNTEFILIPVSLETEDSESIRPTIVRQSMNSVSLGKQDYGPITSIYIEILNNYLFTYFIRNLVYCIALDETSKNCASYNSDCTVQAY